MTSWPLKDTYYNDIHNNCISDNHSPVLPLIAGPVSDPAQVTFNLQYGISNAQINCVVPAGSTDSPGSRRLAAEGRQQPGQRFLLGLVALGDAQRYQLRTAALQTHQAPDAPVKFTDTTGRSFVAPTPESLTAAAKLMRPDASGSTWVLPYDRLRTEAGGESAYPGTLLLSTDVPTKGLTAADGGNFAKLLRYAAGPGQVPGSGNGELPAGYLPITAANGLGQLADYTLRAAAEVASQQGRVPLVTGGFRNGSSPAGQPSPPGGGGAGTGTGGGGSGAGGATGGGGAAGGGGVAGGGAAATGSGPAATAAKSASPAAGASSAAPAPVALRRTGSTRTLTPGWQGFTLPVLLVVGLVSAAAATWTSEVGRR
ncbi:MAG: hypothetical protein JO144_10170 [Actinobacteria bacterium]|nr:hypothetical protein [Actinomycetota bacterium]